MMPFFDYATNFTIHGGRFEDHGQIYNQFLGPNGLQTLLESSVPEAAYDSSARHPPPACLPGTRQQYMTDITNWVRAHNVINSGPTDMNEPIVHEPKSPRLMWLNGPAGVGKSAVAQTCAETLQQSSELGAAFFFSNLKQRDDPDRLFTSIAYQLATRMRPGMSPYGAFLEEKIRKDPSIVTKSITVQFHALIVDPILHLLAEGGGTHPRRAVVIVDGLDECKGRDAQCEILRLIAATSLEFPQLPLLWAIFSRPEPHIESTILSFDSSWWTITLPLSQDADRDIELYLSDNFARIRQRYNLPAGSQSWPSAREIRALVRKSGGLFIYAATIVRFFDDPTLPEREDQLTNLLSGKLSPTSPSESRLIGPLSHLDAFYALIMQRIPATTLPYTLNVLFILANELFPSNMTILKVSDLLGYSLSTTLSAIYALRSVVFLQATKVGTGAIQSTSASTGAQVASYYHYSFVEFLRDPARSKEFHVFMPLCRVFWATRCVRILSEFGKGGLDGITLKNWDSTNAELRPEHQRSLFTEASRSLLDSLTHIPDLHKQTLLLEQLRSLDYQKIATSAGVGHHQTDMCIQESDLVELMNQLTLYTRNQGKDYHRSNLVRERLPVFNLMTRQFLNLTHKISNAMVARTNSGNSTSSGTSSSFSFSSLISARSAPPTPSRVLSVYEIGYDDKKVYLYPERASLGVMYYICTSVEELKEPYIFSDTDDRS